MLKNHNFDLVHALSKKNSAVWRYKEHYQNNAEGCKECSLLWKQMEDDDNKHIAMLVAEIKKHTAENRFD
jgi:hypothetical protein